MQSVSNQFKQAVYAPARRTDARVIFDISDVDAYEDATVEVTSEAEISRKDQLHNLVMQRPAYATFEPNYWKLDGSFVLPPKPDEEGHEVGWYSDAFSDENGDFNPPQVMDFTFTKPHSSIGLTISFDEPAGEYAVDFDIAAYDENDNLIKDIQVRGNNRTRPVIEEGIATYQRIVVTLLKWSKPHRRAKVNEVSFGVVRIYAGENLIKMNVLEQVDTTSATVPADELKFTVDNSSREFNILNPEGSYVFLQQRQSARAEIGVEIHPGVFEYVNMGTYYLYDWQSDEGALTTTFTARDLIDFIPDIEIEDETGTSTNLYNLAESILTLAGVEKYELDPVLQTINTQGAYSRVNYRALLQMIAIAGCCVMHADRNDVFRIERITETSPVDLIDFDNIYREPKINLEKLVTRVEVAYYNGIDPVGTYTATSSISGGSTLKVENSLINSQQHAQEVAEWLLSESMKRALYDITWRQNPALEALDIVTVEDAYGANKPSRIISNEFEFAGYLSGKTKTKGAI